MRALALLVLLTTGCGPLEYLTVVRDQAAAAVHAAELAHAGELAPYEYTAAVEYLHQARAVGGDSRYHTAIVFGAKARDFARAALALADQRRSGQAVPLRAPLPAGNF